MRSIRKIVFVILIVLIAGVTLNVNAAYAYRWTVNGESIGIGNTTKNASWLTDDNYTGGVLTLENYNGGQLKIECIGTGLADQVFAIKLVGDNKITVDKGVGIVANEKVVFIGDGKLTINAAVPIGSGDIVTSENTLTAVDKFKYNSNTTTVIQPGVTVKEVVKEVTKTEESKEITKEEPTKTIDDNKSVDSNDNAKLIETKDNTFLILGIAFCAYVLISLGAIIALIVALSKKSKKEAA